MDLPNKQYKLILVDPPWEYKNKKTGGTHMISSASDQYLTLNTIELEKIKVNKISNDTCLFLWATTPLLPDAFNLLRAWGFKYKTAIYWHKIYPQKIGLGFWFRGEVEVCLIGIKGDIKPFRSKLPNHFNAKVQKHSQKPRKFYEIIEGLNLEPKIELFAREKRAGWDAWGNQVPTHCQKLLSKGSI